MAGVLFDDVFPTVTQRPQELVYNGDVYDLDEREILRAGPQVAGVGESVYKLTLSMADPTGGAVPLALDKLGAWRGVHGALVSLLFRRLRLPRGRGVNPLDTRPVPAGAAMYGRIVYEARRYDQQAQQWFTLRFDDPQPLPLSTLIPLSRIQVPYHAIWDAVWQRWVALFQQGGSDRAEDLTVNSITLWALIPRGRVPDNNPGDILQNPLLPGRRPLATFPAVYFWDINQNLMGARMRVESAVNVRGAGARRQAALQAALGGIAPPLTPWIPRGGCRESVEDLIAASLAGRTAAVDGDKTQKRHIRGNAHGVMMDLNNLRLWCPKIKNHNCYFACVKHVYALECEDERAQLPALLIGERIDNWRKKLGLHAGKLVTLQHIQAFTERFLHRRFIIYDEHLTIISDIKPSSYAMVQTPLGDRPMDKPIELVLFREHYFVLMGKITQRVMCHGCGKRNLKNLEEHYCHVPRQRYYQLKKLKVVRHLDARDEHVALPGAVALSERKPMPHTVYYDFETFFDGAQHRVYAVGFLHWDGDGKSTYGSFYGDVALENFMWFLEEEAEQDHQLTLISYNGSGFDHYFLLQQQLQQMVLPDEFLLNRGRLLQANFWGHRLVDLYNFLGPASLDANCVAYQIPLRKHVFPHLYPKTWTDVTYKGPVLPDEMYPERQREDVRVWKQTVRPDFIFDFEKECEYYLRRDVECLAALGEKFIQSVWDAFHLYLPCYLTLSQMAFDLWRMALHADWVFPLPTEPDFYHAINAATYGGRCHFVKRFFRSSQPDSTTYADLRDYLVDLDVVSLYPASMKGHLFPVGDYKHVTQPTDVEHMAEFYHYHRPLPLSIWRVSATPPTHLLVPALPLKSPITKATVWENTATESQWYTSVDLETARRYGYTFTFHEGYVWERGEYVFDAYIDCMFAKKAEQDRLKAARDPAYNPAARDVFKKLMNALYGKMMQKRQSVSHLFVEQGVENDEWTDFLDENAAVEYKEMGDFLLLTGERTDFDAGISKPHYLGAFILSYSRAIMNRYFDQLDPLRCDPLGGSWLESMANSMFYTDTDSLIVHAEGVERVRDSLGSDLGLLSDELGGGKIVEGYFISPKLYAIKYKTQDGAIHTKVRGKGIPNYMLHLEQYRKMLFENEPVKYAFTQLRKVQADLTTAQERQGTTPFSIISCLNASRTLNRHATYAEPGVLGGRVVLPDVSLSWPIGFEKFARDLDDLWEAAVADDPQETAELQQTQRPERAQVEVAEDPAWTEMLAWLDTEIDLTLAGVTGAGVGALADA